MTRDVSELLERALRGSHAWPPPRWVGILLMVLGAVIFAWGTIRRAR